MSVGASSLTVEEGSVGDVPLEENKTNVLAIVLGICIPVGVLSTFKNNFSHYRYNRICSLQEEKKRESQRLRYRRRKKQEPFQQH